MQDALLHPHRCKLNLIIVNRIGVSNINQAYASSTSMSNTVVLDQVSGFFASGRIDNAFDSSRFAQKGDVVSLYIFVPTDIRGCVYIRIIDAGSGSPLLLSALLKQRLTSSLKLFI